MRIRATKPIKTLIVAAFACCLCSPLNGGADSYNSSLVPRVDRSSSDIQNIKKRNLANSSEFGEAYSSSAVLETDKSSTDIQNTKRRRLSSSPEFGEAEDIKDSKDKANSLIQYAFNLNSFKSSPIITHIRDKLAKALASMTQRDRQLIYNSLIKPITVNRREIYISRILFSMILKNEKAAQNTTPLSLRALFYAITQISSQEDDLSKIITPIMNSKAYKILQKPPGAQAQIIRGVAGIDPKNRFSVLQKSYYKGLLKPTTPAATMTQIFKIFEHISNQDILEYKQFIADQQKRKIFPKVISPDDFPKIFEVFYQSRDRNYQSLVQTAFTKELINHSMSLDNILIILKAFNLIEASIQSDFIDILRSQSLLVEGMKDEDIASTLENLSNVPISSQAPSSSITSIYQELLKKKIINPSWAGQDVARIIRTIHESWNKDDTYWRLGIISSIKSSKFLDSDTLKLYKKLSILNIPSAGLFEVAIVYKQYLHNIREWDYISVFKILNAIGSLAQSNREAIVRGVQQSLAGRNDQTLESVIQMISAGSPQPSYIKY